MRTLCGTTADRAGAAGSRGAGYQPSLLHFLLTKLNLPLCEDRRHLHSDWISRRLELLARHAAQSVEQQTEPFRAWFLLCASDTAQRDKDTIRSTAERLGCLPVWIEDGRLNVRLGERIAEHVPDSSVRILTSRLDSDDVLHTAFSARVRTEAGGDFTGFVNPLLGLHYVGGALYLWPYFASNFISYVEPFGDGQNLRTALALSHDQIYRRGAVRQIVSRPLWLVITHDRNTSTVAERGIRVSAARHLEDFPVLSGLELHPEPVSWRLRGHQLRDLSRLAVKGTRGESRTRLLGGMKSIASGLGRPRTESL
jgi:putative rhamnosyltransferase